MSDIKVYRSAFTIRARQVQEYETIITQRGPISASPGNYVFETGDGTVTVLDQESFELGWVEVPADELPADNDLPPAPPVANPAPVDVPAQTPVETPAPDPTGNAPTPDAPAVPDPSAHEPAPSDPPVNPSGASTTDSTVPASGEVPVAPSADPTSSPASGDTSTPATSDPSPAPVSPDAGAPAAGTGSTAPAAPSTDQNTSAS